MYKALTPRHLPVNSKLAAMEIIYSSHSGTSAKLFISVRAIVLSLVLSWLKNLTGNTLKLFLAPGAETVTRLAQGTSYNPVCNVLSTLHHVSLALSMGGIM